MDPAGEAYITSRISTGGKPKREKNWVEEGGDQGGGMILSRGVSISRAINF
jgi:hypothetical protein